MASTDAPDDPRAAPLDYARGVPSPAPDDDDAREVMGCLLAWLVLVSGLFTGMVWLYWSGIHSL